MESYISNTYNYVKEKTGNMLPEIILVSFIIFFVLLIINLSGINMNPKTDEKVAKIVTVEGFENTIKSFCEVNETQPDELNKSCNKLTKENCNATSCCIWLNDSKCVAGKEDGPLYTQDENNNKINIDNYYYKNKCYGNKCPN
jgi:hypothetical protein